MRILVLVPNSYFVTNLDQQLVSTIRSAFTPAFSPELDMEMVGFAGNPDEMTAIMQKSLLSKAPQAVIGILGAHLLDPVATVCQRYRVPLLAMNAGGDVIKQEDANPYLFLNSFGLYQSAWELGYWAGQNVATQGALISCFHEAGYEMSYFFESGLHQAGATLTQITSTHKDSRNEDCQEVLNMVLDTEPGFLYSQHSSKEAVGFVRDYFNLPRYDNIPLLGAYPMFQAETLPQLDKGVIGTPFISSWIPELENAENAYFRKSYDDLGLGEPGIFSLLAWETIHLLRQAWQLHKEQSVALLDALRSVKFKGPRGTIAYTDALQESTGYSQHLCRVVAKGDGLGLVREKEILLSPYFLTIKKDRQTNDTHGWSNPYLVA